MIRELNRKSCHWLMQYIGIVLMLMMVSGCTITNKFGPYQGKVIDTETRAPLEGAAVLIVFHTVSATVGGAVYKYADAIETVTDKNGEFRLPAHRIVSPGILRRWEEHGYVTIFKPGYGCYPNHKDVKPMFIPNGSLPSSQYVTIELPRLLSATIDDKLRNAACLPSPGVPEEKFARLREMTNKEYQSLGR